MAIYCRVSTTDQTPESQLFALRKFAADRGITDFVEYVDYVTGSFEKRKSRGIHAPAYEAMMTDVRAGKIKTILVWKFDRFARSLLALINGLLEFQRLGVDFISSTQNLDTSTTTGKLMFSILAAFSEFERETIVERTKAGLARARAAGKQLGGKERDPSARERLLAMRNQGLSLRQIARREGYSPSGVFKILRRAVASPRPEIAGNA